MPPRLSGSPPGKLPSSQAQVPASSHHVEGVADEVTQDLPNVTLVASHTSARLVLTRYDDLRTNKPGFVDVEHFFQQRLRTDARGGGRLPVKVKGLRSNLGNARQFPFSSVQIIPVQLVKAQLHCG